DAGGPLRGRDIESEHGEPTCKPDETAFITIGNADENGSIRGHCLSCRKLGFGEGFPKGVAGSHYFSSRLHLRAEHRVYAGELGPGKHRALDEEAFAGIEVGTPFNVLRQELSQLASSHEPGSDLRERDASCLRYERYGA